MSNGKSDYRTVESTESGYKMIIGAQVIYQNDAGQMISRSDYVAERDGEATDGGYGGGGYGDPTDESG